MSLVLHILLLLLGLHWNAVLGLAIPRFTLQGSTEVSTCMPGSILLLPGTGFLSAKSNVWELLYTVYDNENTCEDTCGEVAIGHKFNDVREVTLSREFLEQKTELADNQEAFVVVRVSAFAVVQSFVQYHTFKVLLGKTFSLSPINGPGALVLTQGIMFATKLQVGNLCQPDADASYTFRWSVSCGRDVSNLTDYTREIPSLTWKSDELLAQPGSLVGVLDVLDAVCRISATVTLDNAEPVQSITTSTTVPILQKPVISVITGTTVGYINQVLVLDGSKSCDPNDPLSSNSCFPGIGSNIVSNTVASYEWTCSKPNSTPCDIDCVAIGDDCDFTKPKLRLPPGSLTKTHPHHFQLKVRGTVNSNEFTSQVFEVLVKPEQVLDSKCSNVFPVIAATQERVTVNRRSFAIESTLQDPNGEPVKRNNKPTLVWSLVDDSVDPVVVHPINSKMLEKANGDKRQSLILSPVHQWPTPLANAFLSGEGFRFRLSVTLGSCDGVTRETEIVLRKNKPPVGGKLFVHPSNGFVNTKFQLFALEFQDPENDLPLEYSFQYLRSDTDVQARDIAPFSLDDSYTGSIARCYRRDQACTLIVRARDSLGAQSAWKSCDNCTTSVPLQPANISAIVDNSSNASEITQSLRAQGYGQLEITEELAWRMRFLYVQNASSTIVDDLFHEVVRSIQTLLVETTIHPMVRVQRVIGVLESVLQVHPTEIEFEIALQLRTILTKLVVNLEILLETNANGIQESIVSVMIVEQLLEIISESIELSSVISDVAKQNVCDLVQYLRSLVRRCGSLNLSGTRPGQRAEDVKGKLVSVRAAREFREYVGSEIGVDNFQLKTGGFKLPNGLLEAPYVGGNGNVPENVDVIAMEWSTNLNCDSRSNTFQDKTGQDSSKLFDAEVCDVTTQQFDGPITNIASFVSLEIFETGNYSNILHPRNLDENITITIPVEHELLERSFACGNETLLACGYFVEERESGLNPGWTSQGCSITNVDYDDKFVTCVCNHASDYSVWREFEDDVVRTITLPIRTITLLSIIVLTALFPTLALTWVLLVFLGRRSDVREREKMQKGAIAMLVLSRTRMKAQQRRFFQNLREAKANSDTAKTSAKSLLQSQGNEISATVHNSPVPRKQNCGSYVLRWCKAMYHQHSVFGMWFFDPHYNRVQRASVFCAVVLGNFFVSCFFFQLKVANDIGIEYIVLTVVASSLIIAIPVKFIVKVLFRASDTPAGSTVDRAAQIYRIIHYSSSVEDDSLQNITQEDLQLVLSYQRLYRAKASLVKARKRFEREEAKVRGTEHKSKSTRASLLLSNDALAGSSLTDIEVPKRRLWRNSSSAEEQEATFDMNSDESFEIESPLSSPKVTVLAKSGKSRMMKLPRGMRKFKPKVIELTPLEELQLAQTEIIKAHDDVSFATTQAKVAWKAYAKRSGRQVNIRKQRSALLKLAVLFSEDEPSRVRSRTAIFGSYCVYFGWLVLLSFFGFAGYYVTLFVLTREQVSADLLGPSATPDEIEADEMSVIFTWLVSSGVGIATGYLIVEPLLQCFRFTVLPWAISVCGKRTVRNGSVEFTTIKSNSAQAGKVDEDIEKQLASGGDNSLSFGDFVLEFAAEILESMF